MGNITKAAAKAYLEEMESADTYYNGVMSILNKTDNYTEFQYNYTNHLLAIKDDDAEVIYDTILSLLSAIINAHSSKRNCDE